MRALALALLVALAAPASAQDAPASLVADAVRFDDDVLVAEGSVEIAAGGRILRTPRLTYLRAEDRLLVEGPLTVIDADGTVLTAEFASLGADLRASVLRGARLVLDRRLQIAAGAVARDGTGRRTALVRAVASSCEVCADRPVPLWQIRARRVVHDAGERQLYFEDARFEVAGIPVVRLPRLRLPGPGNVRATGLLVPRFSSDERLGTGVTLPFFVALGPSRDVTLSPYVTGNGTRSLSARYRQAFDAGAIAFTGSLAEDGLRPGRIRGHLFADGAFSLPRDLRLRFDVETVTDDSYLEQYGISGEDRLTSGVALTRTSRDRRLSAEVAALRTLRDGERSDAQPSRIVTVTRERRGAVAGGIGFWQVEVHGRERPLSAVPAGLPPGSARDALRVSGSAGWRRSAVVAGGAVVTGFAEAHLDAYRLRQDEVFDDDRILRLVPYLGLQARLPLVRADGAVTRTLEPVAQVVLAPGRRDPVPNEDSLTPELDEGNLFATTRFAGRDARELGDRVDMGLSYARRGAVWDADVFAGRIWREDGIDQFTEGTGLAGDRSDWLLSVGVQRGPGLAFEGRTLFDDRLETSRLETALTWRGPAHDLSTRYLYLADDAEAGRPRGTSELRLDARYDFARDWSGRASWRYDFEADDPTEAGMGLTYRTECVTVALDVERRFTSTDVLAPTTRFGLAVELVGFGAEDGPRRRRRCGT